MAISIIQRYWRNWVKNNKRDNKTKTYNKVELKRRRDSIINLNQHRQFVLEAEKKRKEQRKKKKGGSGGDKKKGKEAEKPKQKLKWGDEGKLKMSIALQIAKGVQNKMGRPCKAVMVIMGENNRCYDEIKAVFSTFYFFKLIKGSRE